MNERTKGSKKHSEGDYVQEEKEKSKANNCDAENDEVIARLLGILHN